MPDPFTVLSGGMQRPHPYVCPWCGSVFEHRYVRDETEGIESLEGHWRDNAKCKALASVNNPLQSKYGSAKGIENIPGEATIRRIRQPGCVHPEVLREDIYADVEGTGPVQGYRCGNCYTEVYFNVT